MTPPDEPARHPLRAALMIAALGNTALGVAGLLPALLLASVVLTSSAGSGRPAEMGLLATVVLAFVWGWGLLVGYWRAWRTGRRLSWPFWIASTAYNVIGLVITVGVAVSSSLDEPQAWLQAGLATGWLAFMTWLSAACAQLARSGDLADPY